MNNRLTKALLTAVLAAAMIFTGCSRVSFSFGSTNKEKVTDEETLTMSNEGVKNLYVENVVGDIRVVKTEGDSIAIKVNKRVEGPTKDKVQEVMDNIIVNSEVNGGRLEIKAVTKDGKKDFWRWKNDNYNSMNVNIDFYVEVPMNVENCIIKDVTGNIEIEKLAGDFSIDSVTGNIDLKNTTIFGKSNINLVTGNISLRTDIDKTVDLVVSNVTGNLNIALPREAGFSIEGSVVTGNIGGSFEGVKANKSITGGGSIDQSFNDGSASIKFELITGNLDLNKK